MKRNYAGFQKGFSESSFIEPTVNNRIEAETSTACFFGGQQQHDEDTIYDTAETETAPLLTDTQVGDAIRYMRNSYSTESIAWLRQRFELSEGNTVDRDLVMAIAQYQEANEMEKIDGKLGPTSYETLQNEGGELVQDIVLFRVMSPLGGGMEQTTNTNGSVNMLGHFTIEIHFPPGEDCGDYEYRQFICARVEMLPANADPSDLNAMVNLRPLFTVPGGLPAIPNYTEDGNTGLTPQRMGHRNQPGSSSPVNHYLNAEGHQDQAQGCIFRGEDFPGITGRTTNTGEQYEFDIRFMGQVRHKDRGVIARKFWSVRGDFVF